MSPAPDQKGERAEIIRLFKALLLGPREDDETIPSAPADTYLTGILWPAGAQLSSMEDEENDGAPSNEDGETDAGVPGYRTVRPCSIGLTFAADADAAVVVSLAATARYVREEKESPEGGRSERRWRRVQLDYSYEIPVGDAGRGRRKSSGTATERRLAMLNSGCISGGGSTVIDRWSLPR